MGWLRVTDGCAALQHGVSDLTQLHAMATVCAVSVEVKPIQQAFKFALDPTPAQRRAFLSHAGGARYVFNWGHAEIIKALEAREAEKAATGEALTPVPGHFDLCKMWTAYKDAHMSDPPPAEGERPTSTAWVPENFVGTYQAALRDASQAWQRFFSSRKGKIAGRRVGRPRFKKKARAKVAFQVHGASLRVLDTRHVNLPKIGAVRTHEQTRKLLKPLAKGNARLVRGTISLDSRGRWYIALTVEIQREIRTGPSRRQHTGGTIGVDLGVRDLVTLSTGEVAENPRHLQVALRRLAMAQRRWARTEAGSNRREVARRHVARIHGRVAAVRKDHLSKIASRLVHSHELIGVEGWDVQQTLERGSLDLPKKVRRNRNRALASAGLGELRWMLESRSEWYGITVKPMEKHATTGRTCSRCGEVKTTPVPPTEDWFTCPRCGVIDRRLNSAKLVAKMAAIPEDNDASSGGESQNGRGGSVRPGAPRRSGRPPAKRQAGTRRKRQDETGAPGP